MVTKEGHEVLSALPCHSVTSNWPMEAGGRGGRRRKAVVEVEVEVEVEVDRESAEVEVEVEDVGRG